jgi:hypothetical protein
VQHWPAQARPVAQQPLVVQVWPDGQAAQAAPPVPQVVADWELNGTQVPLLQQPLGQQVLPQIWLVGQQVPEPRLLPTQVVPLVQQAPPTAWLRQTGLVEAKPTPQVLPLEQQMPFAVQVWPVGQAVHAAPPVPHSDAHWEAVWRHWPVLSQQPLGQLVALQTHAPLTHAWPAAQAAQVVPIAPQVVALCDAKGTQTPLLQQPLEQQVLPQTWLVGQQLKLKLLSRQVSPLGQQKPPTAWLRQTGLLEAKPIPQVLPLGQQMPFAVQVWPVGQAVHAAPPVPHSDAHWEAVWRHWPVLSQQPLGQLVALQTHAPLTHAWPAAQAVQAAPPVPQVVALDVWQVPVLSQQPLGQQVLTPAEVVQIWLVGQQLKLKLLSRQVSPLGQQKPTTEPTPIPQVWLLAQQVPVEVQDWPVGQAAHTAPPAPQVVADWEKYAIQFPLLSQQPLGQVVALQTQAPFTQAWPAAQAAPVVPQTHAPLVQLSAVLLHVTQTSPLEPHAVRVLPATQVLLLLQQPPLQGLVPLQAELQTWLLHASSVGQSVSVLQPQTWLLKQTWPRPLVVQLAQATPPVPQAVLLVPATQVVPLQQPVGQLVASQTQAPFTQCWPAAQAELLVPQTHAPLVQLSAVIPQATQTRPLEPHAVTVLPATQVPLEQQPPLQGLVVLHAEVQVPLLQASSVGQSVSELQPQTPVAKQTWPAPLAVQLTQAMPPVPQVVVLEV